MCCTLVMLRLRALTVRHRVLLLPAALSAVLSSWALGTVGWGNTYYSAAVRSMSESWSAFWYGSLDSAGFVTVDKPPFTLWVQALAVRVFGFHQLTLLVPQVLAGVGAVVLVYATLVQRWGRVAATIGALALAVTPISVMVNHSNNTDAILTLMMTATVWAAVRAVDTGRIGWVVAAACCFGAAFTSKMLAAAPVLPAMLLVFALAAGTTWRRRTAMVVGGGALAVITALTWFTIVELTPEADRPYIGSSPTNSAYQLAFDRNGLGQVEGDSAMPGGGTPAELPNGGDRPQPGQMPDGPPGGPPPGVPDLPAGIPGGVPDLPADRPTGTGGGQLGFAGGEPGVLRLFNAELGGQIGWLVAPGMAGLLAGAIALRRRVLRDPVLVAAAVWFVGGAAAYSITEGIVHPYYVASIAPPLAMLVGVGVGVARDRWHQRHTLAVVGATVSASALVAWVIARRVDWTPAIAAAAATVLVGGLAVVGSRTSLARRSCWATVAVAAAVLVVPLVWTIGSLSAGLNANLPYAYPVGGDGGGAMRPGGTGASTLDAAIAEFLLAERDGQTWLAAAPSARTAGALIIETGEPVMALGGFSGGDPIVTTEEFASLVDDGEVRFVLLADGPGAGQGGGRPGGARPGGAAGGTQADVTEWVSSECVAVTSVSASLYDCAAD